MPTPEDSVTTPGADARGAVKENEAAEPAPAQTASTEGGPAPTAAPAEAKPGQAEPQTAEAPAGAPDAIIEGEVVEAAAASDAGGEAAETGEEPAEVSEEDGGPLGAELEMLRKQLDEAQVDIKRVAAEYKNYRERVKRDQATAAELATAGVLVALLPVLDDLDRAREHGDLNGPFGSVAEQLLAVVGKFGLTAFGAKGDTFDPKLHEAVAHIPSPDVTEETCIDVMRRGYMLGERLLRPAMVAVAAPQE